MPKQGTSKAHSDAPGEEAVRETKRNLGMPEDKSFYIPKEVLAHFREAVKTGARLEKEWEAAVKKYEKAYPELGRSLNDTRTGKLPDGWEKALPKFDGAEAKATRAYSGEVINAIAETIPQLFGGSADLAPSNNTLIKASHDFEAGKYDGRNIHFGVREHAMGSTMNGMALYGSVIPYGGTFQTFSDYMRPAIRLAALSQNPDDLCFYARFDRPRRGRADASIGRAPGGAAGDPEPGADPPVRRPRDPRSLARRT